MSSDSFDWAAFHGQFEPINQLHIEENIVGYRRGDWHPVQLGDTFKDGRYEIVHKLGWGQFSMVWLARDSL